MTQIQTTREHDKDMLIAGFKNDLKLAREALAAKDADLAKVQEAKRRALAIADERAKEAVDLRAENAKLREVLKPLADYADKRRLVPGSMVITNGSTLAKGQLTMAHCYHAAAALSAGQGEA